MIILLFALYFILAGSVIFVTSKASNHIDEIDSKTNLGSAVLGGVLFAAVTSLPELVTSLVSSFGLGMEATPSLAVGNILGSNLFNMMILGIADVVFLKKMYLTNVDKGNKRANLFVVAMYVILFLPVILFNFILKPDSSILLISNGTFSFLSIAILATYVINLIKTKNAATEEEEKEVQPIKKNIILFTVWSALLVVISVCITLVTDNINTELQLDASFAGAIFLGVATSLPEFTAVITLVKLKNYAAAIGNIIGSSLFNLVILSFVDMVTPVNIISLLFPIGGSNNFFASNEINLLILGAFSVLILVYAFSRKSPKEGKEIKNKILYIIPSIILIANYVIYLILSV